ncbi:MAG: rod shape-determining protein MreC [Bacteroidia bacterium]|nr:rod shape-determining protein MreC [Bacteroidia bacterium]HQV01612.1 rod shape-determining protein MreC [Bacteroidia bacterium]
MRNLIQLLWKYNFLLLFILLQVFCFYRIIDEQKFHKAAVLNSSNAMVANAMQKVNEVKDYLWLRENNAYLAAENARLKAYDSTLFFDLSTHKSGTVDSAYAIQYQFIVAKVVNNTIHNRNNFITVNKGFANGIEPDMGVISASGAVGVVKDVSEHFSTIQSLLHSKTRASVKLKSGFYGPLTWDGSHPQRATLSEIPANVKVNVGDTVVTTAFSTIFPEGVMVGRVLSVKPGSGGDFLKITVALSTNFSNLSHVYIVTNKFKIEQKTLEAKTDSIDKNGN